MKKLIIIATTPISFDTWFRGQAKFLSQYYDIELITSDSPIIKRIVSNESVPIKTFQFTRQITFLQDIKTLIQLILYFSQIKPDIVYTLTPKAGLLGMIASWIVRVPIRFHVVVGLPLFEAKGIKKFLLFFTEKITYFCCSDLYVNSINLKQYMEEFLTDKPVKVIANGSVNGVDMEYYRDMLTDGEKKLLKNKLGLNEKYFTFTFVGRLVRDKGINELIEAFTLLKKELSNVQLLLVGDYDNGLNTISSKSQYAIENHSDIVHVGFQEDIRNFLSISNVCVLPSYREGLPNILIEAGSCGVPLIVSDINGCNEIVIHNENGFLVQPKNVLMLYDAMKQLANNLELFSIFKSNIRDSIGNRYEQNFFWNSLHSELLKCEQRS